MPLYRELIRKRQMVCPGVTRVLLIRSLLLAASAALLLEAQSVRLVRVASGFTNPTGIESSLDGTGRLFVIEQRGRIRILQNGVLSATPFLDITSRISCCDERGLLGLAFPPNYGEKQRFYVYYTDAQGTITISRFRVAGTDLNRADPNSEEVVLRVPHPGFANHNGGRITFGPDGFLYAGLGDGGGAGDPNRNGQNLQALLAKILRIDVESSVGGTYTVPNSNPFVSRGDARPEIWAYGLRNPWRFSFDRVTGDLWIGDVGQDTVEEINFQPAGMAGGQNYGWNITEGSRCYSPSSGCNREGITLPVAEYTHAEGISVTGGFVYRGNAVPALQGAYVYGDFGSGRIWIYRNGSSEVLLDSHLQISTFGVDQDGELYVANYGDGSLYRFAAAAGQITVVNAASFGEGIVPGSLASIFGPGIAPVVGIVSASAFPLPKTLANTSVTLNGFSAPVLAVASVGGLDQINVQVPFELAGQTTARMLVTVNGTNLPGVDVPLQTAQPEIFVVSRGTSGWTIWATGLGPVTNPPQTGQAASSSPLSRLAEQNVRVTVAGVDAPVTFVGLGPGFAGLYQVNINPPTQVDPNGEVVVTVGNVSSRPWKAPVR